MSLRTLVASTLLSLGLLAHSAHAGGVAVVDLEQVVSQSSIGKRALEAYDKTSKAKQAELQQRADELQKRADELKQKAGTLKPDVLTKLQSALMQDQAGYQQQVMRVERDLQEQRAKVMQTVFDQVRPKIDEAMRKHKADVVITKQSALTYLPELDLTNEVISATK